MSDPRGRKDYHSPQDGGEDRPLASLSERLAASRKAGDPAPAELERLVSMLAERGGDADDGLARALQGLARWAESARTPQAPAEEPAAPVMDVAPATRDDAPPEVEARLTAFARTLTEQPRPAPASAPLGTPDSLATTAEKPPIASLRAALAEIAARQKALDAEDAKTEVLRAWTPAPKERSPSIEPAAPAMLDPAILKGLKAEIDRLGQAIGDLPTRAEIDGLIHEMSALSRRLGESAPAGIDSDSLRAIDSLVGEVDRMRGDAATPQTIVGLSDELNAISERLDALGPRNAKAVEALAGRIDEIRKELDRFPRIEAVDGLAAEIQSVVARLDAHEHAATPARAAVENLTGKVDVLDGKIDAIAAAARVQGDELQRANDAIRGELDGLPSAMTMADLSRQIEALTEGLKARPPLQPAAALKELAGKVDAIDGKIAAISLAPEKIDALGRQLETLTAGVASQARPASAEIVEAFAGKIDGLGERMDDIAAATRARGASFDRVEEAVRSIAEELLAGRAAGATFGTPAEIEAQVNRLVEGLDRHDGRLDDLNAAFAGLASRIEQSCANLGIDAAQTAASAAREASAAASANGTASEVAQALAELRNASAQSERRAADALDAVRLTLERLLERVESGAPAAPLRLEPEERPFAAAPSDERPGPAPAPAIDNVEAARAAARRASAEIAAGELARTASRRERTEPDAPAFQPIADLAPDFPLEPGSAPQVRPDSAGQSSAAQTVAALVAAARRAQSQSVAEEALDDARMLTAASGESSPSRFAGLFTALKARKRPLLIGVAATLIVLAALYAASGMTGGEEEIAPAPASEAPTSAAPTSEAPAAAATPDQAPAQGSTSEAPAEPAAPPAEPETPAAPPSASDKRSDAAEPASRPVAELTAPRARQTDLTDFAFGKAAGYSQAKVDWRNAEPLVTGSLGTPNSQGLPDAIGGSTLRFRAISGDPAAQLEVADRLLAGRNVPANPAAAAVWLEKAAAQGLAPAQHRLGSLYEKGSGVSRDILTARRWYERAAASGNVRAMHNLGVIQAEGGLGKPDFTAAATWFRMAAERGLVDSEYNLAVLCARGLGGKRDLVDAYKWFALAAAQGDQDAGVKRDEVAKALGDNLAIAKAAVESFRPRSVDSAANEAPIPPGGWDHVAATSGAGGAVTR
ncbi:hypothetical protein [Hansschlegelia plantiphila]|uniref:hypothetical protein n=1 Tax=Hansschlegelia plantiphila TaxID=374655 RepID=UPI0022F260C4|nr:hypothetical protein [Hansschlegelia plantiphila]